MVWIRIRGSMAMTNGSRSWIRILLFSSLAFKMPTKNKLKKTFSAYLFLKVHLHHFSKKKSPKEVTKQESRFFLLFLVAVRRIRIRIRIHTSDYWIRIREAQKHVNPVDPDPDSDPNPEHCLKYPMVDRGSRAFFIFDVKNVFYFSWKRTWMTGTARRNPTS